MNDRTNNKIANNVTFEGMSNTVPQIKQVVHDITNQLKNNTTSDLSVKDITDNIKVPGLDKDTLTKTITNISVLEQLFEEMQRNPKISPQTPIGSMILSHPIIKPIYDAYLSGNFNFLLNQYKDLNLTGTNELVKLTNEVQVTKKQLSDQILRLVDIMKAKAGGRPGASVKSLQYNNASSTFNLHLYKIGKTSFFPVTSPYDVAAKLTNLILSKDKESFKNIANIILEYGVSTNQQDDLKSPLMELFNYVGTAETIDDIDQDLLEKSSKYIYNGLPESLKKSNKATEYNMTQEENSPLKPNKTFNLSNYILNNNRIQKQASIQGVNDSYLLYGPGEKRICPKLRGRGGGKVGASDIVSEYICRHHCLDGIVIDDSRTICGEAIWRAHSMDKFSSPYKDADGNWVGGYIEKRFEVNRIPIDEENRMQLKPGERRIPRPASQGNLESRLQDMRNKEGEKRNYRPQTDSSKPFDWTKDIDRNNMQKNETNHLSVEYKDREKAGNNPTIIKSASNDNHLKINKSGKFSYSENYNNNVALGFYDDDDDDDEPYDNDDKSYNYNDEPVEGDIIFEDWDGPFFEYNGEMIARDLQELKKWKRDNKGFYPNIWFLSDHGNLYLTTWSEVFRGLDDNLKQFSTNTNVKTSEIKNILYADEWGDTTVIDDNEDEEYKRKYNVNLKQKANAQKFEKLGTRRAKLEDIFPICHRVWKHKFTFTQSKDCHVCLQEIKRLKMLAVNIHGVISQAWELEKLNRMFEKSLNNIKQDPLKTSMKTSQKHISTLINKEELIEMFPSINDLYDFVDHLDETELNVLYNILNSSKNKNLVKQELAKFIKHIQKDRNDICTQLGIDD